MYSYEDRIRAVRLYIRLGKRVGLTIRQLGYPTKKPHRNPPIAPRGNPVSSPGAALGRTSAGLSDGFYRPLDMHYKRPNPLAPEREGARRHSGGKTPSQMGPNSGRNARSLLN
jgi:hypothetical protein